MVNIKRYVLAILVIMSCLPMVISYTPTMATTMANNTATSSFCVRYDPSTSNWSQSFTDYVGCINKDNNTLYGIGIRFSAVTIPQGAIINSARLVVTSSGVYSTDTVSSRIQGEDENSAAAFSTVADYFLRSDTSNYTYWNNIAHWAAGAEYASPDISGVVSEIVNRAGWVWGNNMVIYWRDHYSLSSQSNYMPPNIRGGASYKLVVDYTSSPTATTPVITTQSANDVSSTTTILNAFINSDGNDTHDVAVRFGFDTISHPANFNLYSNITSWSTSNYSSGTVAVYILTGLTPSTAYFFNVQGQNSAGTATGTQAQFVTGDALTALAPSNFVLQPLSTSINLQWTNPAGFSESRLYYDSGSIPSSNSTGALLYSGSGNYYIHTGLTSGTTYGYRLYGYDASGIWSASTFGIVTTTGTAASVALIAPPQPSNWFIDTDYTTQNKTFYYPIVNNIADSLSMPRNSAWATWAYGIAMFFGFLIWSASRSMVAVTLAVVVGVWLGSAQHLIPFVAALLVLVFGIAIIAVRERL